MFEKIVKNVEELNAVALHLRSEGNMEELKELAKNWLISPEDTKNFISGKRYRLAEIKIKDRKYSTPEEKLRVEMFALKDQYFADIIAAYVIKKCREEDFGKYVLIKHKSLQKCLDYVMEKAYQIALEEAKKKGHANIQQNAGLALKETEVFPWAEEYYIRDDTAEETKKAAETKIDIQKKWEKEEQYNKISVKKPGNKESADAKADDGKSKEKTTGQQTEKKTIRWTNKYV